MFSRLGYKHIHSLIHRDPSSSAATEYTGVSFNAEHLIKMWLSRLLFRVKVMPQKQQETRLGPIFSRMCRL
jgi:hypothetical protein